MRIYLLFLLSFSAFAQHNIQVDNSQLETNTKTFWGIRNTQFGADDLLNPEGCRAIDVRQALEKHDFSTSFDEWLKKHIEFCSSKIKRRKEGVISAFIEQYGAKYDYTELSTFRQIQFTDSLGLKYRVHLFLKPSNKPRPLVIIKCGVFCNLGRMSTRKMLMHFYDSSPFHVVLINNMTGSEFQHDNKTVALGGLIEGQGIVDLAKYLNSEAFAHKNKISSTHLFAFSLGAQAAFFASAYDNNDQKLFRSISLACPVVDLEPSINSAFTTGWLRFMKINKFRTQMKALMPIIPHIRDILYSKDPSLDPFMEKAGRLPLPSYQNKVFAAPFDAVKISTPNELWEAHRVQNFVGLLEHPFFVWSSNDDSVVLSKDNAEVLRKATNTNPQFQVAISNLGGHCMMDAAYSWSWTSEIYRSQILGHAPEFYRNSQPQETIIPKTISRFQPEPNEVRKSLRWLVDEDDKGPVLVNEFWNDSCDKSNFKTAKLMMCQRRASMEFTWDNLGIEKEYIPTNSTEAQTMARFLNTNISYLAEDGAPAWKTKKITKIRWRNFD